MAADDEEQSRTMWVGNLSPEISQDLLEELFLQAGPLEYVKLITPRGDQKGGNCFAFVVFKHQESVHYCVRLFENVTLLGWDLRIKPRQQPRNHQRNHSCPTSNLSGVGTIAQAAFSTGMQEEIPRNQHHHDRQQGADYRKRPFEGSAGNHFVAKQPRFENQSESHSSHQSSVRGGPGNYQVNPRMGKPPIHNEYQKFGKNSHQEDHGHMQHAKHDQRKSVEDYGDPRGGQGFKGDFRGGQDLRNECRGNPSLHGNSKSGQDFKGDSRGAQNFHGNSRGGQEFRSNFQRSQVYPRGGQNFRGSSSSSGQSFRGEHSFHGDSRGGHNFRGSSRGGQGFHGDSRGSQDFSKSHSGHNVGRGTHHQGQQMKPRGGSGGSGKFHNQSSGSFQKSSGGGGGSKKGNSYKRKR